MFMMTVWFSSPLSGRSVRLPFGVVCCMCPILAPSAVSAPLMVQLMYVLLSLDVFSTNSTVACGALNHFHCLPSLLYKLGEYFPEKTAARLISESRFSNVLS